MNYPALPQRSTPAQQLQRATARRARMLLWAALLLLCAVSVVTAKPQFSIQPPPAWVQPVAAPAPAADAHTSEADGGVRYLLFDRQAHVTERGAENYYHVVEQVVSAADLEKVSQLQFDFEPSYQQLVIHRIQIVRNGATRDALQREEIKVVQQEDELDQQLFNGTNTAIVFLDDVRAGDVIDYAYSVNGDNPVLAGRYADTYQLSEPSAVEYLHARLLWPNARKLYVHPRNTDLQPVVNQSGAETEYVWERRNVPADEAEDQTPAWFDPSPSVQLSEVGRRAEVARWAA